MSKTIFEKSQKGQHAYSLPKSCKDFESFIPDSHLLRKEELKLPEISEIDLTRHFCELADKNVGIDNWFYPLGSCTMKLNPRVNEVAAALPGFAKVHPLAPEDTVQGCLEIIYELVHMLSKLCGLKNGTLLPNAGAQGEFVGLRLIQAYHEERQDKDRIEVLIPDNAHGTNPATASMAGYKTVSIKTDANGDIDLEHLKELLSNKTACLMLTNPNTLGLFSPKILQVADMVHKAGGLLYYDGANLNPILQIARPGDMGFDVMHINLHKTFSTPHGGGGPGSGPVLCNEKLVKFLPLPKIEKRKEFHVVYHDLSSIGYISSFFGNFAIYLRAFLYAKLHGFYGLRKIGEMSVLNANYLKKKIEHLFTIPFKQHCMHEFVVQADNYLDQGVKALDIAKRLLDYGVHAPTIYFPLIVKEAMLIEPTESESKATIDQFVAILETVVNEIKTDANIVKTAPHSLSCRRLDEVLAVKRPLLKHSL